MSGKLVVRFFFVDIISNFELEKAYLFAPKPELIIFDKVIQKNVDFA